MELIALKRKSHLSQSKNRNKGTTIDLSNQSESDSVLYDEDIDDYDADLVEKVRKELHSEFPLAEVDIFNTLKIEVTLVSTIPLMCFYVACWN